jgi:hypothetical protein
MSFVFVWPSELKKDSTKKKAPYTGRSNANRRSLCNLLSMIGNECKSSYKISYPSKPDAAKAGRDANPNNSLTLYGRE